MPPPFEILHKLSLRQTESVNPLSGIPQSPQWSQPSDIFSVLLILGGDIVHKALAQLVGTRFTPLTFSFGWVSYAISALYASVSNAPLMPPGSECSVLVFTAKNGYVRANISWVLSRIVRDFESWMDVAVCNKLAQIMQDRHNYMKSHAKKGTIIPMPKTSGLCISIYEPSERLKAGEPTHDLAYWSGVVVVLVQVTVASIPVILGRDWSTLVVTSVGTVLAFLTGALPHWKEEKWFGRRNSKNDYILTRGNGAQHAILILGNGHGLNLEDLAVGAENLDTASADRTTRAFLFILSCFWIALLIATAGFTQPSWYVLIVGSIGMFQNLLVAGCRRKPGAMGIHLVFREVIGHMSTMDSLLELERRYPNAGRSLLRTFFPGPLFPDEIAKWKALQGSNRKGSAQEKLAPAELEIQQADRQPDAFESWAQQARSFER